MRAPACARELRRRRVLGGVRYAVFRTGRPSAEPAIVIRTPRGLVADVTLRATPARVFVPSPLQAAARARAACSRPPQGASVCSPACACRSLSPRSRFERALCLFDRSPRARSSPPPWTAAMPRPRCTQLRRATRLPRRLRRRSLALARRPPRRRSRLGLRPSQKKRRQRRKRRRKQRPTLKRRCFSARKRRASRRQPGASAACDRHRAACGRSGRVARRARKRPALTTCLGRRPAFKAVCWNVAGLRAVLNNGTGAVLQRLVADEAPDVICLQASATRHVLAPRAVLL